MKTHSIFLAAVLFASRVVSAENPIPTSLPADRYAAMSDKSPFALATAVVPAATPQASFAANWFVSGVGRIGDSDFVTVKARDLSSQFSLFGHEPNPGNGVTLASVNWSETVGKSTVILQKGTETAKLEFNEADLRGPQPGAPPPVGATPAGMPPLPQPPGMLPQPMNIPNPGMPPVMVPGQAAKQFPPSTGNPNDVHRRVRIINQPK